MLVLCGPALAGPTEEPARVPGDGVYHRPLGNDPGTLDPARIRDIYSLSVVQQVFDGLVQFDQTLTITPALAQFWRASRDGRTWTFILRKGVKFHDGRDVTADDVVYSITRILDPKINSVVAGLFGNVRGAQEFRAGRAKRVAGIAALDRSTVEIVLDDVSVPLVSVLAVGHAKIVPREVVEREGEAFGTRPIGTGPFKFVRWERGKEIVLARNSDYFDGPPRLSSIVCRIFQGEQVDAMYAEFAKGNLEDTPIPNRDYRAIVSDAGHLYVRRPMLSLRFYGLNRRIKPLDDVRVRQALIYAINRSALVEEVFLGRHVLARGILPPGAQGFNPGVHGYAYDPRKTRELLAQAGFPNGKGLPTLEIWSGAKDETFVRMHEKVKQDLAVAGIRAEIHYQTHWPTFSAQLAEGKFPIFLYAWYADVPDPDNFLFRLFYSRSPQNYVGYRNPVADDLLEQARKQTDPRLRVDLYRRVEQVVLDDAPVIPIFHYTYERMFQPYVRSVEVNGLGDPYILLKKIWLDRAGAKR